MKKIQKLPEAPDRKRGDAYTKWNSLSTPPPKKTPLSFSSDQWSDSSKIFIAAGLRPNVSVFRRHAFPLEEAVSFINDSRLIVIYEGLYFDLAQGQMNGAPNETRTHSCRFASLTC